MSYFYIVGIDNLLAMEEQMQALSFVDEAPNTSLFETFNEAASNIKDPEYKEQPYLYIEKAATMIAKIYHPTGVDRTRIDGTSSLWMPNKGLIQPQRAYVMGDYWKKQKRMGPQGLVQIMN